MISIPKDIANIIGKYCITNDNVFSIKFLTKKRHGRFAFTNETKIKYLIAPSQDDVVDWICNNKGKKEWINVFIDYCLYGYRQPFPDLNNVRQYDDEYYIKSQLRLFIKKLGDRDDDVIFVNNKNE